MKKIILPLFLLAVTFSTAFAQKVISDPNVEIRTVTGFHGIDVSMGIKLILTASTEEVVAVSASTTEYRDKIVTEVVNGILKIYYEKKFNAFNKKDHPRGLKAYVSCKTLSELDVNTGAIVEIDGVLKSPSLDVDANTGGTINGEIDITSLKVDQNTGSKITLTGKTESLEVSGDTGSKFLGEDLKTTKCSASVSTGARIYVNVEKELSAEADTGGNIKYKGEGGIKNITTNTGGSVSKI